MENISIIILLLFGVAFLGVLSNRFKFPFPIALVLSGLLISLIPGLPVVELKPGIVFIVFLPPLPLAATSVTRGLGLDPRLISILEGESLVNDASGLIAYKYALTAIMAGNFVLWQAGLNFIWVVLAGVAIGLAIGYLMYLVHKNFICIPVIEVTLTLLTPFASYLLAEQFHVSGVLAVVTTGLYLSFRSDVIFTNESRIMAYSVCFGKEVHNVANIFNEYSKLQIELIAVERKTLQQLHLTGEASEEIIRKIEKDLDLEETRLQLDMCSL
jgi:monovalent cation/hydrogen antiporter